MEIIGGILILLGIILLIVGDIWFLIAAFRESIWWGLACLLLPIVQLFFLIVHWDEAKKPFGLQLAALAVFLTGFFIGALTTHH